MHLPDALDDCGDVPGLELYRATAAHMASHMMYSTAPISTEGLSPAQMFFIGQIEDARIEYKAINEFPGLKKLWRSLMDVASEDKVEHPTMSLLERFAVMLLDDSVTCDDQELNALA